MTLVGFAWLGAIRLAPGAVMNEARNTSCTAAEGSRKMSVLVLDVEKLSPDGIIAATCIQGIANRTEPRVYLRSNNLFWPVAYSFYKNYRERIGAETLDKFPCAEDFWADYYSKKWGYRFEQTATLRDLVRSTASLIKGAVRIRDTAPNAVAVAVTIAGVRDLVPVTDAAAKQWPALGNLPIAMDLRERFEKNATPTQTGEALQWAITEYLPKTNRKCVYSYFPGQFGYLGFDLAVASRMFCYNLGHIDPNHPDGDEEKKLLNNTWSASGLSHEQETTLLDQILGHLEPYGMIWGWDQQSENAIARKAARFGASVTCCTANNVSFHMRMPARNRMMPRQRQLRDEEVRVEDKVYLAFVSGAGDAVHNATGLMCSGRWLYSGRGKVPMNWTVSPYLVETMPGMMEAFYDTRTPNDCFVNETSGYGYNHPGVMPDRLLMGFAEKVRKASELADTHHLDLWWHKTIQPESKRRQWEAATGMTGCFFWEAPQQIAFPPDAPVEISSERYFEHYWPKDDPQKTPQALAEQLLLQMKAAPRPWFTVIYDLDPNFAAETMALLPQGQFKAVLMDELFIAAKKARSKVEGKKVSQHPETKAN